MTIIIAIKSFYYPIDSNTSLDFHINLILHTVQAVTDGSWGAFVTLSLSKCCRGNCRKSNYTLASYVYMTIVLTIPRRFIMTINKNRFISFHPFYYICTSILIKSSRNV